MTFRKCVLEAVIIITLSITWIGIRLGTEGFQVIVSSYGVFFSNKKKCTLFKKNAILCLFLKNVSPSKRVVCFILNNLHFPIVESIAFYALYKLRVLIINTL